VNRPSTLLGWTLRQWANALAVQGVKPTTLEEGIDVKQHYLENNMEPLDLPLIEGVERKMDYDAAIALLKIGMESCV
jgi:hypothetical protein